MPRELTCRSLYEYARKIQIQVKENNNMKNEKRSRLHESHSSVKYYNLSKLYSYIYLLAYYYPKVVLHRTRFITVEGK